MKNRKQRKVMFLLILVLGITIGYALISTTLNLNGIAGIKSNTWDIHWDNESVVVTPNSITGPIPTVSGTNDNTVTFETTLELPGDFYEFTVDAVNVGSIDGRISLIVNKTYKVVNNVEQETTLPSYILYTVKYDDNTTPKEGDVLKSNQSKTYKIRVEYDSNSEVLPEEDTTYKFKLSIDYEQYKDPMPAPRTCENFAEDSWDTIKRNVSLKEDTYPIGCEKTVDLGTYGVHTVRVANNTTPSSCESDNFSQTACGFVLEFKDIITLSRMNPCDNYQYYASGNHDGWEASEIRARLNSGKYTWWTGQIDDYTTTGIYNSFPQDLKNVMSNTYVISGHGDLQSNNFYSNDKLYMLSSIEVWGSDSLGSDTATTETRQLDYYHNEGVTSSNYAGAIKKLDAGNRAWWLRSARFGALFYLVEENGSTTGSNSIMSYGISPAFRIGKDWVLTNSQNPLKSQKWEYYYNNKKKLQDGWYKLKDFSGNDQYYFFENGFMKLGWYTDTNNNTYYLSEADADNNGYVDGNRVYGGIINIDGTDYTFDNNGICTSCN